MAEASSSRLDCGLCFKSCRYPLTLGCDHCFCSVCLRSHWYPYRTGNCPTCHRRSSKEWPWYFAQKEQREAETEAVSSTDPTEEAVVRRKHSDYTPPRTTDKPHPQPYTSESSEGRHDTEETKPITEWFQSEIMSLRKKKDRIEVAEIHYKYMLESLKTQAQTCETQIRDQFNKFHQFLTKEEEEFVRALRQEQEEKTRIMEQELNNIQSQLSSLSDSIHSVEEQLQQRGATDSLIENMKELTLTYFSEPVTKLRSGPLIDQAKILGNLSFKVWRKMKREEVHYSPVILDPNTANRRLRLSEDLTSVTYEDSDQPLPENPERFSQAASVLGAEGLLSGTHQWDVEVGDHPHWDIGLASESVIRTVQSSAESGVWSLKHFKDKYLDVDDKSLDVKSGLHRVCVCVDCDRGELSFYNSKDMTLICKHTHTPSHTRYFLMFLWETLLVLTPNTFRSVQVRTIKHHWELVLDQRHVKRIVF